MVWLEVGVAGGGCGGCGHGKMWRIPGDLLEQSSDVLIERGLSGEASIVPSRVLP